MSDNSTLPLYLGSPPPGEIRYGMDNAPTRKGQLIAMGVATTVVATITVALRLFTRISIVRGRVSPDDCKRDVDADRAWWRD